MLLPHYNSNLIEAGLDEAGRGCLAGPVFAAAVVLPPGYINNMLNDSKLLRPRQREILRHQIEREALAFAVSSLNNEEIDTLNILNASFAAMHKAVDQLTVRPQLLLVDGNRFNPYPGISHVCLIKGDARYMAIAAASILAKTYRDEFMEDLHQQYPQYGWKANKGYPTLQHRKAIYEYGITKYHRKSFNLNPQLNLFGSKVSTKNC
jgi:ribonuclease HII